MQRFRWSGVNVHSDLRRLTISTCERRNPSSKLLSENNTELPYAESGAGRSCSFLLGGVNASVRGSGASRNAFRLGFATLSSLRHCSIGTSTAVSSPCLVTICYPSA